MGRGLTEEELARLPKTPEDDFYCRLRKRRVVLQKCLNDYVNANALNEKNGSCWQCDQGHKNRISYSSD